MRALTSLHHALPLEGFQAGIVTALTERLSRSPRPVLLRSPTGSGKTLMLGRALNDSVERANAVWFWFVPFTNLVPQTLNALRDHCPALNPVEITTGIRFDHAAGDVLVGTAQSVASAGQRRDVLNPRDEGMPGIYDAVARARGAGLRIGLVVDEAHIGLGTETEFGRFCRSLGPDRIVLATATPRDERLNAFLSAAEYPDFEAFTVSRDEVVDAHLNKRYVAAAVYHPNEDWQSLADLQKTVLKRAWEQQGIIKAQLAEQAIALTPLMLVQVANGPTSVAEAKDYLVRDCRVPMDVIGTYEGSDKAPAELQRIAQDPSFEVLIFKEAAGTGFDAPRAFILTSTKHVTDMDFAAQFIGRIMRVSVPVRKLLRKGEAPLHPDLDCGYIFLANPTAQGGFAGAVQTLQSMRSNIEGAIETLREHALPGGTVVYTNRPTSQPALSMSLPFVRARIPTPAPPASRREAIPKQVGLFADILKAEPAPSARPVRRRIERPSGPDAIIQDYAGAGITAYPLRKDLSGLPRNLKSERRPQISDLRAVVQAVVRKLPLSESMVARAASNAYGNIRAREVSTELVSLAVTEREVVIEIDRTRLAAEVQSWLANLPQSSEADARTLIKGLAERISEDVTGWIATVVPPTLREPARDVRTQRDAAYLLLRANRHAVTELFSTEVAAKVEIFDAAPLPDAMLFPAAFPLPVSPKNIYGIRPPTQTLLTEMRAGTPIDVRAFLKPGTFDLAGTGFQVDGFDGGWELNDSEGEFVTLLDAADFVVWWTRNPDRKPYSSGVVRADRGHLFYPDFVVCVRFWKTDSPTLRLLETKFDVIDAAAKSRREPQTYGRVVFLRSDHSSRRMFIINPDGTQGLEVGRDLAALKATLMAHS